MAWLTAGCVRCSLWAAREKLRSEATVTKARRSSRVTRVRWASGDHRSGDRAIAKTLASAIEESAHQFARSPDAGALRSPDQPFTRSPDVRVGGIFTLVPPLGQ